MDAFLRDYDRPSVKPRRRPAPASGELDLFAGNDDAVGDGAAIRKDAEGAVSPALTPVPQQQRSLIEEYVPEAPTDSRIFRELVEIAQDRLLRCGEFGATIGEVVAQYERSGRRVGGVKMEDKVKEQRQTSWLPRVMKAAGGFATRSKRPSPLPRHHHHEQRVWVSSAVARKGAA